MMDRDPWLIPTDYFCELTVDEIFPGWEGDFEVDLGCGDGAFLLGMAREFPEQRFLGVERLGGRVKKVGKRIQRAKFTNARILRLESAYTVGWLLPSHRVSRLHLLCPDPWPKKKHHRRRLVLSEEFHRGLQRILVPNGEFLLKTDSAEYAEVADEAFSALPAFKKMDWLEDHTFYPTTDFERQWISEGRQMHKARWRFVGYSKKS
jgi:tRNA (guanine-N7-)-methyltransferase